jgi:hypothetical protein
VVNQVVLWRPRAVFVAAMVATVVVAILAGYVAQSSVSLYEGGVVVLINFQRKGLLDEKGYCFSGGFGGDFGDGVRDAG